MVLCFFLVFPSAARLFPHRLVTWKQKTNLTLSGSCASWWEPEPTDPATFGTRQPDTTIFVSTDETEADWRALRLSRKVANASPFNPSAKRFKCKIIFMIPAVVESTVTVQIRILNDPRQPCLLHNQSQRAISVSILDGLILTSLLCGMRFSTIQILTLGHDSNFNVAACFVSNIFRKGSRKEVELLTSPEVPTLAWNLFLPVVALPTS